MYSETNCLFWISNLRSASSELKDDFFLCVCVSESAAIVFAKSEATLISEQFYH